MKPYLPWNGSEIRQSTDYFFKEYLVLLSAGRNVDNWTARTTPSTYNNKIHLLLTMTRNVLIDQACYIVSLLPGSMATCFFRISTMAAASMVFLPVRKQKIKLSHCVHRSKYFWCIHSWYSRHDKSIEPSVLVFLAFISKTVNN